MTVALVLAAEPAAGLCGQLTSLGVRRVDATEDAGPGGGLLTVAAAARATGEQMLICGGDLAVPRQALARLLGAERTAGYAEERPGCRAMLVDPSDLRALAEAAEYLASRPGEPDQVSALLRELARRGVAVEFVEGRPDGDADRDEDGLVAGFFADPIARDVARWASERALAPAALMGVSLGLGLVAAIWFSEPTATAKAVAAVTLLAAFVASRAGRVLAAAPGPLLAAIGSPGGRAGSRTSVIPPTGDWLSAAGVGDHRVRRLRGPRSQRRPRPGEPRRRRRHIGDRARPRRRVASGRGGPGGAGRPPDDRPVLRARDGNHGRPESACRVPLRGGGSNGP